MDALPEDIESNQHSHEAQGEFVVKPSIPKESSLIERFVDRIKSAFFQTTPKVSLSGRVHEMQKNADEVLQKLQNIKEELRSQLDGEVFNYVETLIEPMGRDVKRIQKLMKEQTSLNEQSKAFKKYVDWIERAKLWVELESKLDDQVAIIQAIIQHTFADSDSLIEQDLQVISDYESHLLQSLPVTTEERENVHAKVEERIASYLNSLKQLKVKPTNFELRKVTQWKAEVDRDRNHFFDSALHEIDEVVQKIFPSAHIAEEHEHLVGIFTQIAKLEEEIPRLLYVIHHSDLQDLNQKKELQQKLVPFQHEVHQLNLDLRLTPELCDRLQRVQSKVEQIEKLLSEDKPSLPENPSMP